MFVVGVVRHHDGVVHREEVLLEALEDEVLVVRVADEAVGARADRRGIHREVAAPLRVRLREDRHLADAGQVDDEKARIGHRNFKRPSAVVHGLVPDPGLGPPARVIGAPAAGVIGRQAAVVVFGVTAHALVAEHHVVGGEDRAVVERRRNHRRPDRDGIDPLRRGERWDRIAIAGILVHGRVEDGAMRVVVGGAAGTRLIQAPAVLAGRGDDRGVQIDLVERPGHGELVGLGHAARDDRGGLPGRLGGLLGGGDGSRGGLGGGGGGLPGGGRSRSRGVGRGLGGGGGRSGVLGARLAGGGGGGFRGIGGRLRDGGGARVAGGPGRVGRIACRIGGGLGGSGRLGRVIRFGRFGRHRGGGFGGFGGAARGIGGVARGLRRGCGVARRGVDRRRVDDCRPGVIVVVAAADQREAGRSNASFGAGSQHGAARDLSLSQTRPIVPVAHHIFPSGSRLSLCGTARCVSARSLTRSDRTPPPPTVMSL